MVVTAVFVFRVHPGKWNEFLERSKTIKKLVEKAGGTYSLRRQVYGAQPGHVAGVAQYPDWNALAKVRSDPEFVKNLERVRTMADPAAEPVAASIFEDVPL
jgi:hypothetical protein